MNGSNPEFIAQKVTETTKGIEKSYIACLGQAFKDNVDNFRENPAVDIYLKLEQNPPIAISAVEPYVSTLPASFNSHPNVTLSETEHALAETDLFLLFIDHTPFQNMLWDYNLSKKVIIGTHGQHE